MLKFSKMHGLGNDFMVIDAVRQTFLPDAEKIRRWADRHTGVGFDQLLVVEPGTSDKADFRYRIFNADGGEVGQCGNGARCFAVFVREQGLTDNTVIRVETRAGPMTLIVEENDQVTVDLGPPRLAPADIPLAFPEQRIMYVVDEHNRRIEFSALSLGNPHAVLTVTDCRQAPVEELGAWLENHPIFPERANIGFMEIENPGRIRLRVFERGAGETRACGSGACAAVVAGRLQGRLEETVQVELPGGSLTIHWPGPGESVKLKGPATRVYTGLIDDC